jgi:hypothetical protein
MNQSGASETYVAARSALLDALEALTEQRDALILVGAQAIYLHTGEADVAIATTTKDSDVVVDPALLDPEPKLEEAMRAAGFQLNVEGRGPGEWVTSKGVPVDLLVPTAKGGAARRRGARIPPHASNAARQVTGLEACLFDNEERAIVSLSEGDSRQFRIRVAGPAALLIAKLHKLGDRQGQPNRLLDKDAHDIYRLLRATATEALAEKIRQLMSEPVAADVTARAIEYLRALFETPKSLGSVMAGRAEEGVGNPEEVAASVSVLGVAVVGAIAP